MSRASVRVRGGARSAGSTLNRSVLIERDALGKKPRRWAEKRGAPRDEALKKRTVYESTLSMSLERLRLFIYISLMFHDSRFDRGLGSLATPSPHSRAPHGHASARPTVERARTAVSGFSRERPGRSSRTLARAAFLADLEVGASGRARSRRRSWSRLGVGYARTRLLGCSRGGRTTNARARTTNARTVNGDVGIPIRA